MNAARLTSILLITASLVNAQGFWSSISIGIKGGLPWNDAFQRSVLGTPGGISFSDTHVTSRDYLVGPMIEVRLPAGFAVEADGLFRPVSFTSFEQAYITPENPGLLSTSTTHFSPSTWEIPVLAKYRFKLTPALHPYVEAGPSFREASWFDFNSEQSRNGWSYFGAVIGTGIELKIMRLRLAPEVRYIHWGPTSGMQCCGQLSANQNQGEFLVGLSL